MVTCIVGREERQMIMVTYIIEMLMRRTGDDEWIEPMIGRSMNYISIVMQGHTISWHCSTTWLLTIGWHWEWTDITGGLSVSTTHRVVGVPVPASTLIGLLVSMKPMNKFRQYICMSATLSPRSPSLRRVGHFRAMSSTPRWTGNPMISIMLVSHQH